MFERIYQGLTKFCDMLTAEEARSTEVLLHICRPHDEGCNKKHHLWLIMAKRVQNPKFAMWCPCDPAEELEQFEPPYDVMLRCGPCRIGGGPALVCWTSAEVARHLLSIGSGWIGQRLAVRIPHRGHLLSHEVVGNIGPKFDLVSASKGKLPNVTKELREVMGGLGQRRPPQAPRSRPVAPRVVADAGAQPIANSSGDAAVDDTLNANAWGDHLSADNENLALVDEDFGPILDLMGPAAIAEMSEALAPGDVDDEGGQDGDAPMPDATRDGASGSSSEQLPPTLGHFGSVIPPQAPGGPSGPAASSSTSEAAAQEAGRAGMEEGGQASEAAAEEGDNGEDEQLEGAGLPDDGSDITDPSTMHYMYRDGRTVCRVNPSMGSSIAVKCYLHSKCTLLIAKRHMPPIDQIKRWIASAELPVPGEPPVEKEAKGRRHMASLRALRDSFRDAQS